MQESPHYNLIAVRRWNYFRSIPSDVITAPNSDLNITDGQTDRRTLLWHHRATQTRSPMLRSKSAWALSYLAVKLFSKNSNLC